VHEAIAALRAATGVERVCLLGVRLGALLATRAAVERHDVAGLIALAGVTSGKQFLREQRALQMTLTLAAPPAGSGPPNGVQEAAGFAITSATKEALGAIDLTRETVRPAPAVLLLDRDDMPPLDAWMERLRSSGAVVEHQRLPGYNGMVLNPHHTMLPLAMIAATTKWLGDLAARPPVAGAAPPPAALARKPKATRPPGPQRTLAPARDGHAAVVETASFLDDAGLLFGITSRPAPGEGAPPVKRKGVLLLNAGAINHIGPNRVYVAAARHWAARGHVVVRADISGIGDSSPHPGERDNVVYTRHASADVTAALAYLRRQPEVGDCYIVGLCSGAYNAFKAAVKGQPVVGIIPINPFTFFWKEGMPLDFAPHKVVAETARYGQSIRRLESWKKLLRGQVKLDAAARVATGQLKSILSRQVREAARRLGRPLPDDLGSELESLADKGIDLTFLFASGEPGLGLLRSQGGSPFSRLHREGRLRIEIIDGPDHTFTPLWTHALLVERLTTILERPRPSR
jgi:dienelactone hydrolase